MNVKRIIGIAVVLTGAVLLIFFKDAEFFWFTGGPLGLALVFFGLLDIAESFRKKPKITSDNTNTSIKQKVIDLIK